MSLRDYFDHHKSIDNCFLSEPFSGNRLYLFDEIKKLTNHLFKITAQPETPHNANQAPDNRVHDMNTQNLNPTQTASVAMATKSNTEKSDDVGSVTSNVKTRVDMLVDENNNKIDDADGKARSHPFSEIFKKFASLADAGSHVEDLSNAPWPVSTRRTKFRINQMSSRDVPIVQTKKPAMLTKQYAIDACDTKLFDERISRKSIFHEPRPNGDSNYGLVDLLESFEHEKNQLFQSHFRHSKFADRMTNGSISFDCGQIGVEQRSINTIRSLFQLHASTGRNVKLIQAQIEGKNK